MPQKEIRHDVVCILNSLHGASENSRLCSQLMNDKWIKLTNTDAGLPLSQN